MFYFRSAVDLTRAALGAFVEWLVRNDDPNDLGGDQ